MDNIIQFKGKLEEPKVPSGELMFDLSVYDEGEGRGFEIAVVEGITDAEVFSCLLTIASEFAPEGYFDDLE